MDFTFTEDQLLFRDEIQKFLVNEVTPEKIRARWETESGRSDEFWTQLAELGVLGMTVPEAFGGLGGVSLASQVIGTLAGIAIAVIGAFIVYGIIKKTVGLRLTDEDEYKGADLAIHKIGSVSED